MLAILRAGGDSAALERREQALATGCDAFAAWRWKTLATVASDLGRLEDSTRAFAGLVKSAIDLSSRDSGAAATMLECARDDVFWQRRRELADLVRPVSQLTGWTVSLLAKRYAGGCRSHARMARHEETVPHMIPESNGIWDYQETW